MASVWDELKDLFKSQSQKEEEKQNKLKDALEREKEVDSKLKELDEQYKATLPVEEEPDLDRLFPKDSGLKEMEYEAESDEEIERKAKQKNDADRLKEQNKLDEKYFASFAEAEGDKIEAEQKREATYEELGELYKELREQMKDKALANGVARGSILSTKLRDLDDGRSAAEREAEAKFDTDIAGIDDDLRALERDREAALEQLDLKYAASLEENINKLKDERDKKIREYEKYNSSVREKNAKYLQQRELDIVEYLADLAEKKNERAALESYNEKKYGYSGEKRKNYEQRYELAYDFYSSLSPDIALEALEASPNMKYYLGIYYDALYNALKPSQENKKSYY